MTTVENNKNLTKVVSSMTGTKYCYGHLNWIPIARFDKSMHGVARALCISCQERRNKRDEVSKKGVPAIRS